MSDKEPKNYPDVKFGITEEVVHLIQKVLQAYIDHIDADCARSGCMCDLAGPEHSKWICDVLHEFDSGLHLLSVLISHPPTPKTVTREQMDAAIEKYHKGGKLVESSHWRTRYITTEDIPAFLADLNIEVEEKKV
jgi:hypothetical protein